MKQTTFEKLLLTAAVVEALFILGVAASVIVS